jgi:hypothetical protein
MSIYVILIFKFVSSLKINSEPKIELTENISLNSICITINEVTKSFLFLSWLKSAMLILEIKM